MGFCLFDCGLYGKEDTPRAAAVRTVQPQPEHVELLLSTTCDGGHLLKQPPLSLAVD